MSRSVNLKALLAVFLSCGFLHYAEAACSASMFKCANGICINFSLFCNGADNCGDNSDEKFCDVDPQTPCPPGFDRCPESRRCIPWYWICDGYKDCKDLSEEENCTRCSPSTYRCTNGKCLQPGRHCNKQNDCDDKSDESYCDIDPLTACPPGWDRCPESRRCIPSYWTCDGFQHCNGTSEEKNCASCSPRAFQCSNGKCEQRHSFCDGIDDCGDNSDESFCNIDPRTPCPSGWNRCPDRRKCIPSNWMCDGWTDCNGTSEEIECGNNAKGKPEKTMKNLQIPMLRKNELKLLIMRRRRSGSRTDRWGSQVHRIAVALHLSDNSTFGPGNLTGEEIRYELTLQLLYRLPRNKMSSQELAMYIHALLVACMDPRDFYGGDLVRELRRRVEASNYTNPFLLLVLCNVGDTMTAKDVERVTAAYDSQHRPFWTDFQALSTMALSCIASRHDVLVDERTLMDMLQELKKHQFRNGTVDNFRTTALVTQALFIHDSYLKDFDLDSAIKVLVDGLNGSKSLLNAYYLLPVLHGKSLLNVSSSHCSKQPVDEEDALQKELDIKEETITVQYSVWLGDEINLGRTWRLRMLINSTIYDAIETVANIDNRQKVEYNVVDGKPYVASMNGREDDPEIGMFWFIYLKALNSDEHPKIVEQSPVDITLTPNQEIILWYKRGPWDSQSLIQKHIASS